MSQYTTASLGRLKRVDPRDIWVSEPYNFTPWLAEDENLALLSETLEIDLELEAQEQAVGPYRADILCKEIGSNRWVLIENQLEKTDHIHLGQLLTYAAGLDAVTIVWLSPRFTDEHRACLDWLNRITAEGVDFFGVEVEVWKIGESAMAPRFNLVSSPNAWTKTVAAKAQAAGNSDNAALQLAYWSAFREVLEARNGVLKPTKAHPQNWMSLSPFNRSGFTLGAGTNKAKKRLAVDLYLGGKAANAFYKSLLSYKEQAENSLGQLVWHDAADQDRRVIRYLESADPTDQADWKRQHDWIVDSMEAFYKTFAPIVAVLKPADTQTEAS